MHINWLTLALIVIVLWSVAFGLQRRFAPEFGSVLAQLVALGVTAAAVWAAWRGSTWLANYSTHVDAARLPKLVAQVLQLWQQSPGIARAIAFVVLYIIISAFLNRLLIGLVYGLPRVIPAPLARSRTLGGVLGAIAGGAHAVILGALVFLFLQFLSAPLVAAEADASAPYQLMRTRLFEPYLSPLLTRELPVYAKSALAPLSKNINMFVVPTGSGTEQGVLIVPRQVAAVAKQVTAGQNTALAKAHALYEWEIHHVSYDWKKYDEYVYHGVWEQQSPLQTLQTGKGVCADYALLYADLAHSAGLSVRIDEGLGGSNGQYGSHAWNRVYIPSTRQWIPVDTTWGAEQGNWFDPANFSRTHIRQIRITIPAYTGSAG